MLSGSSSLNIVMMPLLWPISLLGGIVSNPVVVLAVVIPIYFGVLFLPLLFFAKSSNKIWLLVQLAAVLVIVFFYFIYGKTYVKVPYM